jgi:uncharacterized protein with ParB-like and HNH nuclease domain
MKIACFDQEIRKIFETNYYKIPRFQRPYSWDKDNIEDFWNDVIGNKVGQYFLGSMVVYVKGGYRYLVDGQQRLTTITILLAALRDKFLELDFKNQALGIQKLIERPDLDNDNQFVIQSVTSFPFFQQHIQAYEKEKNIPIPGDEEIILKDSYEQLISYLSFDISKAKTTAARKKRLEAIRDALLGLLIIYVEVDNEDDAYVIFETLNTRGKDLTSADLLKNYLAKLLRQKNSQNDVLSISWEKIRFNIDKIDLTDVKLETFLYHYWLATKEFTTEREIFKKAKENLKTSDDARTLINSLKDCSETYLHTFSPSTKKWKNDEYSIKRSLEALVSLRVRQPVPMTLAVLHSYKNGELQKKETERALKAIEYFHFAFTALTSQRSSGGISHMYALHARELTHATTIQQRKIAIDNLIEKLKNRLPSEYEFVAGFKKLKFSDDFPKDKRTIQYTLRLLYELENPSVIIDPSQMSIEHIEPQSSKLMDKSSLAEIGNLWLLSTKQNNEFGNMPVVDKIPLYKSLGVVSDPVLNRATTAWDITLVSERTEYLGKKMWGLVSKI